MSEHRLAEKAAEKAITDGLKSGGATEAQLSATVVKAYCYDKNRLKLVVSFSDPEAPPPISGVTVEMPLPQKIFDDSTSVSVLRAVVQRLSFQLYGKES